MLNTPYWETYDPDDEDDYLGELRAELEALLIAQGEKPRYAAYLAETLTDDEVARWLAPTPRSQEEILARYRAVYEEFDIPF